MPGQTVFIMKQGHAHESLQWRYNGRDGVSNHQPHHCLLNGLFKRRSKKTSKLRITGLCAGIHRWPVKKPAQMASNAQNVSIWWRHHVNCWAGARKLTRKRKCRHFNDTFITDYIGNCHCDNFIWQPNSRLAYFRSVWGPDLITWLIKKKSSWKRFNVQFGKIR